MSLTKHKNGETRAFKNARYEDKSKLDALTRQRVHYNILLQTCSHVVELERKIISSVLLSLKSYFG